MLDNKVDCREITSNSLKNELIKIHNNYMKVFDEYYKTGSRDSAFLKDLVDSLIGISAVLEVYCDGNLHPSYAVEKLNSSMSYIKSCLNYYSKKLEQEDKD